MKAKEVLKKIYRMAKLKEEYEKIKAEICEDGWFDDLGVWDTFGVMKSCKVQNGTLYDSDGNEVSDDCRCMDEPIPYAVNQSVGFCGDDFYGTMYIATDDKGTFVAVDYSC